MKEFLITTILFIVLVVGIVYLSNYIDDSFHSTYKDGYMEAINDVYNNMGYSVIFKQCDFGKDTILEIYSKDSGEVKIISFK